MKLFRVFLLLYPFFLNQPFSQLFCTTTHIYPEDISRVFVEAGKKVHPAIVQIVCYHQAQEQPDFDPAENKIELSQGSGFFISHDGYLLTNAHLIEDANKIEVTLSDRHTLVAVIVFIDKATDLAILQVRGKDFPYLQFGNSNLLEVGEMVLAAGCPLKFHSSLTMGLVSAKNVKGVGIAEIEDFIQTNAQIHLGNSGGPLLNLRGEVVGINTAALISNKGSYIGISLAISSNLALDRLSLLHLEKLSKVN